MWAAHSKFGQPFFVSQWSLVLRCVAINEEIVPQKKKNHNILKNISMPGSPMPRLLCSIHKCPLPGTSI